MEEINRKPRAFTYENLREELRELAVGTSFDIRGKAITGIRDELCRRRGVRIKAFSQEMMRHLQDLVSEFLCEDVGDGEGLDNVTGCNDTPTQEQATSRLARSGRAVANNKGGSWHFSYSPERQPIRPEERDRWNLKDVHLVDFRKAPVFYSDLQVKHLIADPNTEQPIVCKDANERDEAFVVFKEVHSNVLGRTDCVVIHGYYSNRDLGADGFVKRVTRNNRRWCWGCRVCQRTLVEWRKCWAAEPGRETDKEFIGIIAQDVAKDEFAARFDRQGKIAFKP